MKLHSLYIMLCLCCLSALTSCRDDAALPDGQSNVPAKTLLVLNFTIDGKDAASRAEADDTPKHPAADWENNTAFFHLFIRHADGTWENPIILFAIDGNASYEIELDQTDLEGDVIYLGANLSTLQAATFVQQQQAKEAEEVAVTIPPYNLTGEGFNLVTDFSPYSTFEPNLGRNHIAMFCTEAGTPVKADAASNTYTVSFDLKRMVAKVLVTCKTDDAIKGGESDIVYVPVEPATDYPDFEGWIRQEDVKYLVNGLNRKAYIMQQINEDATEAYANVIDPNNTLSTTIADNNFFFQQVEGEIDNGFFRSTVQFDKTRLSTDENYTGNPYTEGIYCPENTFAIPDAGLIVEGEQAQVTHVNVAARFTPGKLHVGTAEDLGDLKDFIANDADVSDEIKQAVAGLNITDGVVDCPSEAVARQLLASSLEMAANNNGFPSGTYFYHYTNKTFYTYGGMVEALGHEVSISDIETSQGRFGDFVPYLDGWGYYYTYVDNRESNYGEKLTDTKAYQYGQVERNRYYILNITKFTRPGSSVTNPEYIQVHTYSLSWKYGGEGDITLDPSKEVEVQQ